MGPEAGKEIPLVDLGQQESPLDSFDTQKPDQTKRSDHPWAAGMDFRNPNSSAEYLGDTPEGL